VTRPAPTAPGTSQSAFDRWIFGSFGVSARGLALYRIAFALFGLLITAPGHAPDTDFARITDLPDVFFLPPPGPMQLVGGFPGALFFDVLTAAATGALVCLLIGYRTRWASAALTGLLLVGFGFSYSLGKVNHNLLFVLTPLIMGASGWGAALSLDARAGRGGRVEAWPLTLLMLLVGFGFFTAGFTKLIGGWLALDTQATLGHLFKQFYANGRQDFLAAEFLTWRSAAFWEAMDWATIALECGLLVAAFRTSWARPLLVLVVFFHMGTLLMLNIAFAPNMIVYAAFLPWLTWAARLPRRLPSPPTAWLIAGALVVWIAFTFAGSPLLALDRYVHFTSDLTVREVLVSAVAGSTATVLAARWVLAQVRRGATGRERRAPSVSSTPRG
jgi:hypothetical protein